MSHHDLALLTIGFLVGVLGASIVAWVRSASYERWADGCAQEADHTVTHPSFAHELTAHDFPTTPEWDDIQAAIDSDAVARVERAQWGEAARRLSSVAPVVPIQRGAVE